MSVLSLKQTNKFTINQVKKKMKIILTKRIDKKFFFNSVKILNDTSPIHTSKEWANRLGFKNKIFPGLAVVSVFSKLIGMYLPGKNAVIMNISFSFKKPVFENNRLTYICEVTKIIKSLKVVLLKLSVLKGSLNIIEGEAKCKILNLNE